MKFFFDWLTGKKPDGLAEPDDERDREIDRLQVEHLRTLRRAERILPGDQRVVAAVRGTAEAIRVRRTL